MPLRAFGDVQLKWSRELQQSILANLQTRVDLDSVGLYHYTPPHYLTPPYLDAAPDVIYHKLRPQDSFLILGTDGLWDEIGSKEAVRIVGEHLSGIHLQVCIGKMSKNFQRFCKMFSDRPLFVVKAPISPSERQLNLGRMHDLLLKRQARDSLPFDTNASTHLIRHAVGTDSYGELCHEKLTSMLTLPEDLARLYRDDVTVTVVFLNSSLARREHRSHASLQYTTQIQRPKVYQPIHCHQYRPPAILGQK